MRKGEESKEGINGRNGRKKKMKEGGRREGNWPWGWF
jgi:hypothetical protein